MYTQTHTHCSHLETEHITIMEKYAQVTQNFLKTNF